MRLLEIFKSENNNIQLDKKTLVILRWIAIIGQFVTINFVYFILGFNFPFFYCCLIILFGVLTNVFLQFKIKENLLSNLSSTLYLIYDLIQLAVLVFFYWRHKQSLCYSISYTSNSFVNFFINKKYYKFIFYHGDIFNYANTLSFSSAKFWRFKF